MATVETEPDPSERDRDRGFPVVLGIALDDRERGRLAAAFDRAAIVMFTPDVETAHAILGDLAGPAPANPAADGQNPEPVVRVGALEVDRLRCQVHWHDTPLALTRRERELLACLACEPGRVRTYQELYAAAWSGRYLDPGPVYAVMKRLRRKLRQAGTPVRVEAVLGVGYQLVEPKATPG